MPLNFDDRPSIAFEQEQEMQVPVKGSPYEETSDTCRICRGEASAQQPLFHPCKCSGSIKFVHQDCLMEWLSHSQKKYCELCKTSFRFTKLYDRSMPQTLPFPLFLRQLSRHVLVAFARYIRYLVVALVWTCCLPWCIRQIWRGLFWLADGNWLDEDDIQAVSGNVSNITFTAPAPANLENASSGLGIPKYFERISLVFPPMQLSLADIARAVFSQGLIGRLIQLFFTLLVPRSRKQINSTASDAMPIAPVHHRPSSLLSDVHFLAKWSTFPILNNATIDIMEGQLICILLVTAFILVFLIREWVINQQPIHNMPDPDDQENPAPQAPAVDVDGAAIARLRRRNAHQIHDHPHADQETDAPVAMPRPRRAFTDDNISNASQGDLERPVLHARSTSLVSNSQSTQADDSGGQGSSLSSAILEDPDFQTFRNRTLSNSILVRSELEIVPGSDAADFTGPDLLASYVDGSGGFDGLGDALLAGHPDPFNFDHRNLTLPVANSFGRTPDNEDQQDSVLNSRNADQQQSDAHRTANLDGNDDPVAYTDAVRTDNAPSELDIQEDHGNVAELDELQSASTTPTAVDERSRLQTLSAWLWEIDGDQTASARPETPAAERVIEDIQAEAPFVPIQNPIQNQGEAPEIRPVAAPVAPAREPNIVFGVDLNDPNAADDAEDLDGILELLGMEGPIFGMVQNVIFSLFLITITLSASIWCPYIWGKIALLFITNPVGMLIKAPLFVLSRAADIVIDVIFFVAGLFGLMLNQPLKLLQLATNRLVPVTATFLDLDAVQNLTLDLSQRSGARLERTLSGALLNLKPDLPTFSMLSHHALRSFKASSVDTLRQGSFYIMEAQRLITAKPLTIHSIFSDLLKLTRSIPKICGDAFKFLQSATASLYAFGTGHSLGPSAVSDPIDNSLVAWSTEDRIITIILGYAFFAAAGVLFLELARLILGLKDDEKVEGYFADCLRQAGGVMKVIVIIGIEMLVFPLYCGLLLDVALLPLFANATLASRIEFLSRAPFTGIFIHWFIGTCYMFHFALFVSICRKILRKGVLYFIRDPDDPTFHPVRDVLERPVPTQLGKIAFSALVYGGLVMICLGGVVWSINWTGVVLPIQWATSEPKLAFPVDIVFYNFMLPFVLRKTDPSKKITSMYEWWFRWCARTLRISAFLFGEDREEETTGSTSLLGLFQARGPSADTVQNGTYVRAPASDSVRIPRGQSVFLEVSKTNERLDGRPDIDTGMHGKKDDRFVKVYLPPNFRARIAIFIFLLWLFAASTGVAFTICPLLLGRKLMQWLSHSTLPPNDLYAFTLGVHIFALATYGIVFTEPALDHLRKKHRHFLSHYREGLVQIVTFAKYISELTFLGVFTALVLPCVLATIVELYLHVPLFTYLEYGHQMDSAENIPPPNKPTATIFILQTWTIGLLYLRLCLRLFLHYIAPNSQAAIALRAIVRDGILRPDVRLASRAFVLPATVVCTVLLGVPLALAKAAIFFLDVNDEQTQMKLYRIAYPGILAIGLIWYVLWALQVQVAKWRVKIRDEVYLIGERLHNFNEPKVETRRVKQKEKIS